MSGGSRCGVAAHPLGRRGVFFGGRSRHVWQGCGWQSFLCVVHL